MINWGKYMRARELFEEKAADLPSSSREAMPRGTMIPDLDGDYEFYRLVTALAGVPDNPDIPLNSIMKDKPLVVPYTELEYQQVQKMLKKMKKADDTLTKAPSGEADWVHKTSPVRQFRDHE